MPRIKTWIDRIPLILQHLEIDAKAVYTRPEVQELFIIGRSQAVDLMKIAGAEIRNGAEATVSRDNLRYYVQRCPEAKAFLDELDRKRKLAAAVQQTALDLRARSQPIEGANRKSDEWTRLKDLPNVELTPGMLRIVFGDHQELIRSLWKLSKAMANEPEVFRRICGERSDAA